MDKHKILSTLLIFSMVIVLLAAAGCAPQQAGGIPSPTPGQKASPTPGEQPANPAPEATVAPGTEGQDAVEPEGTEGEDTEGDEEVTEEVATTSTVENTDIGTVFTFADERTDVSSFATSSSKVWVGNAFGEVDIYNPSDGSLTATVQLVEGNVNDLQYDGKQVWALVDPDDESASKLFVLNPDDNSITKTIDLPEIRPDTISVSNGNIWVGEAKWLAFGINTTELAGSGECSGICQTFTVDTSNHIWIGTDEGILCLNASDFSVIETEERAELIDRMVTVGDRVWGIGYPPYELEEYYDTDKYPEGEPMSLMRYKPSDPNATPNPVIVLQDEYGVDSAYPSDLITDGTSMWVMDDSVGTVNKHDGSTGKRVGTAQIVSAEEIDEGTSLISLSFDGKNAWVLTPYKMIRLN